MKKILFVMNTMGRAGAEMALLELLSKLREQDAQLFLYVLTGQGELFGQLPEGVTVLNKKPDISSVHTKKGKYLLAKTVIKAMLKRGTIFKLFPYICRQAADMVRKRQIMYDKLLWRVLSDGAVCFPETFDLAVAYIEGGAAYYVAEHVKAKKKAAFVHIDYNQAGYTRALDKDCYCVFDKIFPVSDEVKDSFLQSYPECAEKTEVFHNLINREKIIRMAKEGTGFTDTFDGYRILTVGRLTSQKDFAQSIWAMYLLKKGGINARWYLLGEGEQRGDLEKLCKRLGLEDCFFICGAVENPYPYMAQADLYVHATRFEGKSIAIQEAQVLGCAILVSDCSGNREQVVQGVDGRLCELTPEAICEGIRELLESKEKRICYGQRAAERMAMQKSDVEKIVSLL